MYEEKSLFKNPKFWIIFWLVIVLLGGAYFYMKIMGIQILPGGDGINAIFNAGKTLTDEEKAKVLQDFEVNNPPVPISEKEAEDRMNILESLSKTRPTDSSLTPAEKEAILKSLSK